MKVNFSDLIKAVSVDMQIQRFGFDKQQAVKKVLQDLEKPNAGEQLPFSKLLEILTSAEYKFENQITDFGQKSSPNYDGDDVDYETIDFSNEMDKYFTGNLASICEAEFGVEDATTLTFIF
jgi:hypothetical protein